MTEKHPASRPGTRKVVPKPGAPPPRPSTVGGKPAAAGPRPSHASSRVGRMRAEPSETPGDGSRRPTRGKEFWIKLGVLGSVPILLVLCVLLYFAKVYGGGGDGGDGFTPDGTPIPPVVHDVDALAIAKDWVDQGFHLRAEAMQMGDPEKKRKIFESSLGYLEKGQREYEKIRRNFPGPEYAYIEKEIDKVKSTIVYIQKELKGEDTPQKPVHPPEFDQAKKMKEDANKKYQDAMDEADLAIRMDLLGEASTSIAMALRRLDRAIQNAEGGVKIQMENEKAGWEGFQNTIMESIDRAVAEQNPPEKTEDSE